MRVITIIPARGGSKGIPGKNLKEIAGKPLIDYTLDVVSSCESLSKIVVSSDSQLILDRAADFPGITTHLRDDAISGDRSPVTETIQSVLESVDQSFDAILLLQPTSPLRKESDIINAINYLESRPDANSVISVIAMDDVHPARMYWTNERKILVPILPEYEKHRRQDIPKALYRNGAIYLFRTKAFRETHQVMVSPSIPYEMPYKHWLNIDDRRDLLIAESLIPAFLNNTL